MHNKTKYNKSYIYPGRGRWHCNSIRKITKRNSVGKIKEWDIIKIRIQVSKKDTKCDCVNCACICRWDIGFISQILKSSSDRKCL